MVDERDIIRRVEKGDITAMKTIFDNYYRMLSLYALQYVTTTEDAEDIVQDALVSFWNYKKGAEFYGSVKAYLFGAVKKSAATFIKKSGRYIVLDYNAYPEPTAEETDRYEEDEVLRRRLRMEAEVDRLPEKSREVFKAIALDNMRYKDVAAKLGVSVNTVKTHYVRALRQLRSNLGILLLSVIYYLLTI